VCFGDEVAEGAQCDQLPGSEEIRMVRHPVPDNVDPSGPIKELSVRDVIGALHVRSSLVLGIRWQVDPLTITLCYDRHQLHAEATGAALDANVLQRYRAIADQARRSVTANRSVDRWAAPAMADLKSHTLR
jgi:hypothetical protein